MRREIPIHSELGTERNDRIQAWALANGVSPRIILMNSVAVVDTEANEVTFTVFQKNEDGTNALDKSNSDWAYLKCTQTVPLLSAPEDHNL